MIPYEKSFASFLGETKNGKLKIHCWHPTKNGKINIREIRSGSNKKYWFNCDICNHDFKIDSYHLTRRKQWCPYCSNQKLCNSEECKICFEKSFASYTGKTKNGKLKKHCWYQSKNKDTTPRTIAKQSTKKYWFKCDICNHDFDCKPSHIYNNCWCPYCSSRNLCINETCNICYEKSFASYTGKTKNGKLKIHCWHQSKNKDAIPRTISKTSNKKYWFKCDNCPHDFKIDPYHLTRRKQWCPYCSNNKICNSEECKTCFEKSFASYTGKTENGKLKIDCWHLSKNKDSTPRTIAKQANKKYWFKCDICNHDFDCNPANIYYNCWCPYCCIPSRKLCFDETCNFCYKKSFASYTGKTNNGKLKIHCWHQSKNKNCSPRTVLKKSHKKCWFTCDICHHDFRPAGALNQIVSKDTWCPYCSNQKLCNNESCDFCYKKSFQYILDIRPDIEERMTIIFPKNVSARAIPAYRNHQITVICKKCNNTKSMFICSITAGNGCGICKNKTEKKLLLWFQKQKKYLSIKSIQTQYNPLWCGTKYIYFHKEQNKIKYVCKRFPFDYLIEFYNKKKVIIELDGEQHYKDKEYFQKRRLGRKKAGYRSLPSSLHQQIRDRYKEMQAKKHKLSVIRVIQEDVWRDKNNWEGALIERLKHYE